MTEEQLLALIKSNIPVTTDAYDPELLGWMKDAERDISRTVGMPFDCGDPVQTGMVILYVRAHFGDGDERALLRYRERLIKLGIQETY